ncbi:MAG: gliding motility protein GldL [Bacteroidaceae bacterium]|nr:gliding motility protein GldL [Bacteroidaceae bacterium]
MPKPINFVIRLQSWMDSVPGQTFLNYAYSWGASIVILGALFKLTHMPGGNLMLFLGMGTEVIVFFISAFDRPFEKSSIGKELPDTFQTDEEIAASLEKGQTATLTQATAIEASEQEQATDTQEGSHIMVKGNVPTGGGTIVIGTGIQNTAAAPDQAPAISGEQVTDIKAAPVASGEVLPESAAAGITIPKDADAEQLSTIIREANNELLRRAQAVLAPEMEAVTKTYIERLRNLTDTLSKVEEQGARMAHDNEEMERLSRTLTSINSIYELQLKGASSQIVTIDQINEQTHQLVRQIEELNGVYARMIKALTINAKAAGGAAAE